MTDEEMVAAELAELDRYTGQQARAEAALLRKLPVEWAASVLREDTLNALAGNGKRSIWDRYLRLEEQVRQLRTGALRADGRAPDKPTYLTTVRPGSLWSELDLGDEPEPLRWQRRARGTEWWGVV